jgi:hypothetical protein
LWRGERVGILSSMPTNLDAWDDYFEVYQQCAQLEPPDFTAANEHYTANRATLDAGSEATWAERKQSWELSATQAAMNLYCRDRRAFWSEYMNRPQPADMASGAKCFVPRSIAERLNGHPRGIVPPGCSRLTCGIDVGGGLLWWCVVAWNERFGGSVVDYGCWPKQNRAVFAASEARPSLSSLFPQHTDGQKVFAGLRALIPEVVGKGYAAAQGGELKVERCLIDAGWEPDSVYQSITASPLSPLLLPSKGFGRSPTQVGVAKWKPRPGEKAGYHWRLSLGTGGGRGRQIQFDPDAWKSFAHGLLTVPEGGTAGLTLFGEDAGCHELFAEHVASEYSEPVTYRGDTFDKWVMRPHRTDNHLLDALVLAAVAASVQGLTYQADGTAKRHEQPKPTAPPPAPGERVRIKPTRAGV